MSNPRTTKLQRLTLIGAGGFFILVALFVLMAKGGPFHLTGPARILAGTAGTTVLVAWWGLFMIRVSGAMDEYQRWAEHRAWYCGGLLGLVASVPVFTFIGLGGLEWLYPGTDAGPVAARAFASGYMLPTMMQVAGSTGFAIWWRFAKR